MAEEIASHPCSEAGCSLGREILCSQGTGQPDHAQEHQHGAHLQNIGQILLPDSRVYDLCHDKGNKQLEAGLQHFK